jgi:hypothetical protein
LERQIGTGTLIVSEANGEPFAVVLDAAVVGQAPWRGSVAAGVHSVLLRGDHRGTPPVAVTVKESLPVALSLRAVALDAEALVQPDPPSSTIFVDGVFVGNGAWSGALPSGTHRFEVVALGRLPFRDDVVLRPNLRTTIHANLGDSRSAGAKQRPRPGPFYVEPTVGLLFGESLRGSADAACGCSTRSRPSGWLGAARLGYTWLERWGVELSGGYMSVSESVTRPMSAIADSGTFNSANFRDAVTLSGPFAAVGGAFRFFRRLPLTTRVSAGLATLKLAASNSGTFSGKVSTDQGPAQSVNGTLSLPEASTQILTPCVSSEVRLGYRLSAWLSADVGLALSAFFPTDVSRSERRGLLRSGDQETARAAGVLVLPDETVASTFLAVSPSVAMRLHF